MIRSVIAAGKFKTSRGTEYLIEVGPYDAGPGGLVWVPYRNDDGYGWERVSTMTRSEERKFPKSIAAQAHALWKAVQENNPEWKKAS